MVLRGREEPGKSLRKVYLPPGLASSGDSQGSPGAVSRKDRRQPLEVELIELAVDQFCKGLREGHQRGLRFACALARQAIEVALDHRLSRKGFSVLPWADWGTFDLGGSSGNRGYCSPPWPAR